MPSLEQTWRTYLCRFAVDHWNRLAKQRLNWTGAGASPAPHFLMLVHPNFLMLVQPSNPSGGVTVKAVDELAVMVGA